MKVEIKMEHPQKATIKVNDQEIKKVTGIKFDGSVGHVLPIVTLSFIPSEIGIDIENAMVFQEKNLEQYSPEELMKIISEKLVRSEENER